MKRAKITLTAIAVLAIVGGALAFKAQRFGATIFAYDYDALTCTLVVPNLTTAFQPAPATSYVGLFTTIKNSPCVTKRVYSLQ